MAEKTWGELLAAGAPDLGKASDDDRAFMERDTALPTWVKYVIATALDAVANHPNGCRFYGKMAVQHGATREQIADTLRMVRMFNGRPGMVTGAEAFRDLLD
jgi:alkylhydroperoxidase/carboxymuconolactone decarboxylase family protein YurZ